MQYLSEGLIVCKLNSFLSLKDKIQLRCTNKFYKDIQKKTLNYHIGEIISDKLGINISDLEEDMKTIKDNKIYFIKAIEDVLCNRETHYRKEYKYGFPMGTIFKVNNFTLSESINNIRSDNIIRYNSNRNRKYSIHNLNILKRKFINTYVLLLS